MHHQTRHTDSKHTQYRSVEKENIMGKEGTVKNYLACFASGLQPGLNLDIPLTVLESSPEAACRESYS